MIGWMIGIRRVVFVGLVGMVVGVGCQRTTAVHRFPVSWPSSPWLDEIKREAYAEQPVVSGAVVAVEPVTWVSDESDSSEEAEESPTDETPTTSVLQQIAIQRLRAMGVEAVPAGAAGSVAPTYRLFCEVRRMECVVQGGYPTTATYLTSIRCQLKPMDSDQLLWERQFAEPMEQVYLVNTMSRLPINHFARQVRDNVIPSLNVVLGGVRRYLDRSHGAPASASVSNEASAPTAADQPSSDGTP